jgi:hypothetical protein
MPPFVQQVLGAFARSAVIWVAARLGSSINEGEATQIVVTYIVPAAMLAWSVYQKYKGQQKLLTALASPQAMTEQAVEAAVAAHPSPSVNTAKTVVPTATA